MRKSYILAAVIAVAATGWVLSGQFGTDTPVAESTVPAAGEAVGNAASSRPELRLPAVRVQRSSAQEHEREVVARGRTEALRRVTVRAEVNGKVASRKVEKGARVQRGDVIAQIEIKDRRARLQEAKALARQRALEFEAAERLREKGFRAATQHAAAEAQLDAARAMVKRMEIEIALTAIRAPFDGVVDELPVEEGDYVDSGDAVAEVVDEDPFLIIAQVSENDVGRLRQGGGGYASLVTGERVEGHIRYIATTADENTRTFRVELEVPNRERRLRDGITAELHIPTELVLAHRVSAAVLTLDDHGTIGVRCVDANNRVEFFPVDIIASETTGVWVTGLPDHVDLIVVGQEFVRSGDEVRPTRVEDAMASS